MRYGAGMSRKKTYAISCPTCGHSMQTELYDALNVGTEPERRDELMANTLNAVRCPGCGFQFRVDKPLLYHDPKRRFMIYWLPTPEEQQEQAEQLFAGHVAQSDPAHGAEGGLPDMHLVFSRSELVERIFLLEAGMNPRVIEYIKYSIYTQNMDQVDPASKRLLFDAEDSTADALCFVVQDAATHRLESVLHYSRSAYQGLCEMFDQDDQTPSLLEMFPGPCISARSQLLRESEV